MGQNALKALEIKAFSGSLIGFKSRTGHQQNPKANTVCFRIFAFGARTDWLGSTVRARQFIADALRGFPFKGVGDSRRKVRFRLVKGHQQKRIGKTPIFFAV